MNLSTEPSIETLPEFYANGAHVVDSNVINDQTIANFCSDTIRELNNLTEELQHSDLDEVGIRNTNHDNQINSLNTRFMETTLNSSKSVHDDAIGSVQSHGDNQINAHNSHTDHNYAIPYHNNTLINNKSSIESTEFGNTHCDVVDSSPFYAHFNKHLENNMDDDRPIQISTNNLHHTKETYEYRSNGRASSEGMTDDDYRVAMCMLQSVDLRGKCCFSVEIEKVRFK